MQHQCQRLFRQLGFRLRKPRPQVAQSDPLKVAAVKKTPSPGSPSRRQEPSDLNELDHIDRAFPGFNSADKRMWPLK
jgi:hypothetical protein